MNEYESRNRESRFIVQNEHNILALRMLINTHSDKSSQTDKQRKENRFALRSISTKKTMIVNLLSVTRQGKESHQLLRSSKPIWERRRNNPAEAGSCPSCPLSRSKEVFLLWRDPAGRWLLATNSLIPPECVLTARLSRSTSSCHSLTSLSLKLIKSPQYISWNWSSFVLAEMTLRWRAGCSLGAPHFGFCVRFAQTASNKCQIRKFCLRVCTFHLRSYNMEVRSL